MIVSKIEVPPDAEAALEGWMQTHTENKGFRASQLVEQVKLLGVPSLADENVAMRVADRMIQKHKHLRHIKLRGANNWCWSPPLLQIAVGEKARMGKSMVQTAL